MKKLFLNPYSLGIFIILAGIILFTRLFTATWNNHNCLAIISWDVFGYYLYLPAWIIHHDLGINNFSWVQQILTTYNPTIGFYQAYMGPAGDYVMKYPMGLAILYFPFFIIGHIGAHLFGYSPDGFTLPYQVSLALGGVIYTIIGLWFFRKVLLHFFSDHVAALTFLVIVLGTNYFELTAFDGAMPHNYLFTIYAVIVWLTIRWHADAKFKYAVPLGLLCGLAILVRPTAGVIVLVPLLWGFWDKTGSREKMLKIREHYGQVLTMVLLLLMVAGLQLLYWKIYAGSWFYYSYEKGEQLEWIAPYLWKVLFSYKKGWLVYTPLMMFAILGFIPLARKYRPVFIALLLFFIINLLTVASWPNWWYGGSFGQRALMESYLLLSIPLGTFIMWFLDQKVLFKWVFIVIIFLFTLFNLFQTWQYTHYIIDPMRMTESYYWRVFGKTSVTDFDRLYLIPSEKIEEREVLPVSGMSSNKILARYDFENGDPNNQLIYCKDTANSGRYSMRLSKKNEFSPGISIPYNQLSQKDFAWVQACGYVYFTCKPEEVGCALVITCLQNEVAYKYRIIPLEKENLKPFVWNKVCMDYLIPNLEKKSSPVQAYFWYRGDKEVLVDDFEIKLFEYQ
ncbi:MAG: hypothetical protein M0Q38_04765 [Bacteroidales bacterium]|jgi:hypothetical protein|nr:hypothetical protein [Bacteroidales bacterium]